MNHYKNYFSYLYLLRGGFFFGVLLLTYCGDGDKYELNETDMNFVRVTDSLVGYAYDIPAEWREETPAEVKSISKIFKNIEFRIQPCRIFYDDSTNSILIVSRISFAGGNSVGQNAELYLEYLATRFNGNVNRYFINGHETAEIISELESNVNRKNLFEDEGELILFDFTTGRENNNNEIDIVINTVKKIP
ncbi:MAG: hypothetical protein ACOYVE_10805 [Melioribacter sp.]|uniref:hypothetical protein n=1 Tax=Melioribacter sp. TaxID=2052167 RepID=UPI003BDA7341